MLIRSLVAAIAGLAIAGCTQADAGAAEGAPAGKARPGTAAKSTRVAQVTGAAGFTWGTPYDSVVAKRGAPGMEQPEAEGVRALMYDEQVLGREMAAMFFIHPRHGLMRGGYMAPYSGPADCAIALQLLDNVVTRRYPDLPTEVKGIDGNAVDICNAAIAGQAPYGKVWSDSANGARIALVLPPQRSGVLLTYTTPDADAWERRKNDARF